MKWLVFSDSHGERERMIRAVERERPDRVLHLGDVVRDGAALAAAFPDLPVEQVRGNCDYGCEDLPLERELFFNGRRIWMLHGHTWQVKYGVGTLASEARSRGVDAVLFGHTHKPLCSLDGVWIVNPGTVGGRPDGTYGVLEERDGELYCRIAAAE